MMRVFVPATLPRLAELHQIARLAADGGIAYAVTPTLREWYTDGDLDELEYAALTEAAQASLGLGRCGRRRRCLDRRRGACGLRVALVRYPGAS